jgi:hypothetical protein
MQAGNSDQLSVWVIPAYRTQNQSVPLRPFELPGLTHGDCGTARLVSDLGFDGVLTVSADSDRVNWFGGLCIVLHQMRDERQNAGLL